MKTEPVKPEDLDALTAAIPNPHDRLIHVLRNGLEIEGDGWPVVFRMTSFAERARIKSECGTVACIAGFAGLMLSGGRDETEEMGEYSLVDFLGVAPDEADRMAFPDRGAYPEERHLMDVTADQAIKMLEIHRDTGKVDWKAAFAAIPF